MTDSCNFLLAGVGGQGTILASDVLAEVALASGLDVKKSEVHGMAQRGGSVNTHVRWAAGKVYSPLVSEGEADILLAFEEAEALRYVNYLRQGGVAVVNRQAIKPITVSSGGAHYPSEEDLRTVYGRVTDYQKTFGGVYSRLRAEVEIRMVNAKTGQEVMRVKDSVDYLEGGIPLSPLGAIMSALSSAANLREIQETRMVAELAAKLVAKIPQPEGAPAVRRPLITTTGMPLAEAWVMNWYQISASTSTIIVGAMRSSAASAFSRCQPAAPT